MMRNDFWRNRRAYPWIGLFVISATFTSPLGVRQLQADDSSKHESSRKSTKQVSWGDLGVNSQLIESSGSQPVPPTTATKSVEWQTETATSSRRSQSTAKSTGQSSIPWRQIIEPSAGNITGVNADRGRISVFSEASQKGQQKFPKPLNSMLELPEDSSSRVAVTSANADRSEFVFDHTEPLHQAPCENLTDDQSLALEAGTSNLEFSLLEGPTEILSEIHQESLGWNTEIALPPVPDMSLNNLNVAEVPESEMPESGMSVPGLLVSDVSESGIPVLGKLVNHRILVKDNRPISLGKIQPLDVPQTSNEPIGVLPIARMSRADTSNDIEPAYNTAQYIGPMKPAVDLFLLMGTHDDLGSLPGGLLEDVRSTQGEYSSGFTWMPGVYTWASPSFYHRPLYFEQVNLERYGIGPRRCVQPLTSGMHFFGSIALMPYKVLTQHPHERVYSLGHQRPGDPACYQGRSLLGQSSVGEVCRYWEEHSGYQ